MRKIGENQILELGRGEDANPVPANAVVDNMGASLTLRPNTRWKVQVAEFNVSEDGGGEAADFELVNVATGFSFYTLHAPTAGPVLRESESERGLGLMIEVGATPIVVQLRSTNRLSVGGALPVNGFVGLESVVPNFMSLNNPITQRITP